ncbi:MAG: class I SAM-dependent methyltransferase [Defluviitaleaceae bacterium]|nr:class I SAM-dependent methyltransferase [Defluviitaleaceae bacterium]
MLDNKGFDLWAQGYDESVQVADDDGLYPFAGYKDVMNIIFNEIMAKKPCAVLDIGIGTGVLASRLYDFGNSITGVDFSQKMLEIAKENMPNATMIYHDITFGVPDELKGQKFDFIVMTYSVHHLSDAAKLLLFHDLAKLLNPAGKIIVGDVAFETESSQQVCIDASGDEWDEDEYYIIMSEMAENLEDFDYTYRQISHCAGILSLTPR